MGYAWIIDTDHLFEESEPGEPGWTPDEAGTMGPRNASDALIARLKAGEGEKFQMFDDDGILYYTGRIVYSSPDGPESEEDFGPLDDFGRPNAGAVDIKYLVDGNWTSL